MSSVSSVSSVGSRACKFEPTYPTSANMPRLGKHHRSEAR
jgi:hypothetical protein